MEYGDDMLRRLAEDPKFTSGQWGSEVVTAYRKRLQVIRAAEDLGDLRALASLDMQLSGETSSPQSSIRLTGKARLVLALGHNDQKVVTIMMIVASQALEVSP